MRKILLSCILLATLGMGAQNATRFPLQPDMARSQVVRWLEKPVLDSMLVDDFEAHLHEWYSHGIGTIAVVDDNSRDGSHALRYRTLMRDSLHLTAPGQRTSWGSFGGEQGGENRFGIRFSEPQDWSRYNRLSVWVYVHPDRNKHHHFFLYLENEGTDYSYPLEPRHDHCVQNLVEGQWQQVVWEFDYLDRSRIRELRIFQTLVGHEPSGDDQVTIDFDRICLQRVVPDHYDGYQLPQGQIAYSHIGYRPHDDKVALAAWTDTRQFSLVDEQGKDVYSGKAYPVSNRNGSFAWLDFSAFTTPGTYRLRYDGSESEPFPVGDDVWQVPFTAGLNFYYCQQCGVAVEGYHDACHQDWFGFHDNEKKPINGGFHDAGDLSQGYFRTALAAYVLLRSRGQGSDALARHAVDWIMKTRFADGYHISWARQRIWSDNREGTIDDVAIRASNPAWENFLGAAVLAMAAKHFADDGSLCCDSIAIAAKDNWQQAFASREAWTESTDNEAAWGTISSVLLWQLTGSEAYAAAARQFGSLLLRCQEQQFVPGTRITGYFYTDTSRRRIVQNNHGAFYESPLIALRMLCEAFPEADRWLDWYRAASIYADCFLKPGTMHAAPFNLLPNAVYRRADIERISNDRTRRSSMEQYRQGWQLNDDYCLRTFPIWGGDLFHGATCCHLSTTWALAEASQLRHDRAGLQVAKEQLEWTLGRNPFGQSLMYGVGYNWASQFVYCSKDMVGGLPVGMDSFRDDAPYWHGSDYATSKETWIGTVNRFMGALTAFIEPTARPADAHIMPQADGTYQMTVKAAGQHTLSLKTLGGHAALSDTHVSDSLTATLTLRPADDASPAVAVVFIDGLPLCDVVK